MNAVWLIELMYSVLVELEFIWCENVLQTKVASCRLSVSRGHEWANCIYDKTDDNKVLKECVCAVNSIHRTNVDVSLKSKLLTV